MGFFNFYLGTAFILLATGYLLRRADGLKAKDYAWLGLLSLLLYATHLFALLAGCVALIVTFVFVRCWPTALEWRKLTASEKPLRLLGCRLRGLVPLIAGLIPGLVLATVYMLRTETVPTYVSIGPSAWHNRPRQFVSALSVHQDRQYLLLDAMLALGLLLVAGAAFGQWLRQRERRVGAVWAVTLVFAGMFLITPERVGLGSFLPHRLAWTKLLFAVVASGRLLATSRHSVMTAVIFSLLLAVKLAAFSAGLRDARRVLVRYEQLTRALPTGCTVLRINYPTPALDRQYGLERLYFAPLYHAVDGVARAKRCFSWGNYQVLTGELQFPVQLRPEFRADAIELYRMEFAPNRKAAILKQLLPRYAEKIDFILLAGEPAQPGSAYPGGEELAADFQSAVVLLESHYELIAADGEPGSLRLYHRRTAPPIPEPQH